MNRIPFAACRGLLLLCCSIAFSAASSAADDFSPAQKTAIADVASRTAELAKVNETIWNLAEVGLKETKSSALLIQKLQSSGFEVKQGVSGMPTAFVASYGRGKPIIGILAEYDALPGMSQTISPTREPRVEGAAGHACGHSGLGTGALGAALAVKTAMEKVSNQSKSHGAELYRLWTVDSTTATRFKAMRIWMNTSTYRLTLSPGAATSRIS